MYMHTVSVRTDTTVARIAGQRLAGWLMLTGTENRLTVARYIVAGRRMECTYSPFFVGMVDESLVYM